MADVEGDHIADSKVVTGRDLKIGVLIHQLGCLPMVRHGLRSYVTGPIMDRGHGKSGIKRCIASTHSDDGFSVFGDGLDIGPDMKGGNKAGRHAVSDGVILQDTILCFAVRSDIVGKIASRPEDHLGRVAETCGGEHFGDYVVPRRAGAGEQERCTAELFRFRQIACSVGGMLQEFANGGLVVENSFV